ncbi:MAG: diaminopimelate dehydrogenase [Christensenellaceae bacterium]|jgi:diaminopimelate dehydrogenase|nr:diaminopimelate dehydrogenase [Christensenellaceae bacterium]
MEKIKIAVVGNGNLGRCVAEQAKEREEFELVGVFSRRDCAGCLPYKSLPKYKGKIDVVLMCAGSSDDAPKMTPEILRNFSTVDSFDTHALLHKYIKKATTSTTKSGTTAIISTGWDPGLFSVIRIYLSACLTRSKTDKTHPLSGALTQTFWGKGVSMGHSNAVRNIDGVIDAIQFTVPVDAAVELCKKGEFVPDEKKHRRVVYLVARHKDQKRIEKEIRTMPNYFEPYETEVNFIEKEEFDAKFKGRLEHAGLVVACDENSSAEFKLKLKSNPYFTATIMLAYAIANYKLQSEGTSGIYTVADIAPKYLQLTDDSLKKV